ncbi:MAG: radical SAM family heme chaperone HemW [Phycisphaerae bacterium]|nr:radical SAM family heme chaperone HemW [Phycisphaerae bacterium]
MTAPSLYVHIPLCVRKCPYCGFYSEPVAQHNPARLVGALAQEVRQTVRDPQVPTVYVGGGSPTCMPMDLLGRLLYEITRTVRGFEEFTVEANPGQVDRPILQFLRNIGVNRLSLGGQSFQPQELKTLGRLHTVEQIVEAVEMAREVGFENIGVDLIFAIPGSTMESWRANLKRAIDLGVTHISTYALTYEEDTPLTADRDAGRITPIDEETDREMYELAIDMLTDAGYEHYEISNFARPGFACRHNLGYWANRPYNGVGPSAASHIQRRRCTRIADIRQYIHAVENELDPIAEIQETSALEFACETAVLNLRRIRGIDWAEYRATTGYDAMDLFAAVIEEHRKNGMLTVDDSGIRLTRPALPIADSILCDFSDIDD